MECSLGRVGKTAIDYRPAIAPGETLSIVRETDRGYWIKKNGVSGWYSGHIKRL